MPGLPTGPPSGPPESSDSLSQPAFLTVPSYGAPMMHSYPQAGFISPSSYTGAASASAMMPMSMPVTLGSSVGTAAAPASTPSSSVTIPAFQFAQLQLGNFPMGFQGITPAGVSGAPPVSSGVTIPVIQTVVPQFSVPVHSGGTILPSFHNMIAYQPAATAASAPVRIGTSSIPGLIYTRPVLDPLSGPPQYLGSTIQFPVSGFGTSSTLSSSPIGAGSVQQLTPSATLSTDAVPVPATVISSAPYKSPLRDSEYDTTTGLPLVHSPTSEFGGSHSTTSSKRRKRKRSAFVHELKFKGNYQEPESGPFWRIRVWVNDRNMQYYDCSCGKRKPVQDLYKIKQHVLRHDVEEHRCTVCGRVFQHHLQMNAHMKVHKRKKTKSEGEAFSMSSRCDEDEGEEYSESEEDGGSADIVKMDVDNFAIFDSPLLPTAQARDRDSEFKSPSAIPKTSASPVHGGAAGGHPSGPGPILGSPAQTLRVVTPVAMKVAEMSVSSSEVSASPSTSGGATEATQSQSPESNEENSGSDSGTVNGSNTSSSPSEDSSGSSTKPRVEPRQ